MDTTLQLLKQEINQSTDTLHDLAKWKLIVVSALAAAALGLTPSGHSHYSLVLLIPYACAYVDLNCYQHLVRIAVISRFLREQDGDKSLQFYERQCEALRTNDSGVFNLTIYGQLWSSVAMSIVAPIWALFTFAFVSHKSLFETLHNIPTMFLVAFAFLWIFGFALVLVLYGDYRAKERLADTQKLPDAAAAASLTAPPNIGSV